MVAVAEQPATAREVAAGLSDHFLRNGQHEGAPPQLPPGESGETDCSPTSAPTEAGGVQAEAQAEAQTGGDGGSVVEAADSVADSVPQAAEQTPEQVIADLQARLAAAEARETERAKWDRVIAEQTQAIDRRMIALSVAEDDLKDAKAERDRQKEKLESLMKELHGLARDAATGQKRMDFEGVEAGAVLATSEVDGVTVTITAGGESMDSDQPAAPDPAGTAPVTELCTKFIKKLIGGEQFARQKELEQPVGLTDKVLEDMGSRDLHTIADLERLMRENSYWWKEIGLGQKGADRVVETLRVWREKHPYASQVAEVAEVAETDSETETEAASASDNVSDGSNGSEE